MHRSYGEPAGALPKRDEEAWARAMSFRNQEKAKYKMLEEDNGRLRSEMAQLQLGQTALLEETAKIKGLWEELSKPKPKANVTPRTRAARDTASVLPRIDGAGGSEGVGEPTKRRSTRKRVARVADDEAAVVGEAGGSSADGGREVRPADVPDPRGSTDEHPTEGPERGGGVDSAEGGGDVADPVGED
jgi:hypothetical protein